MVELDNDMWLKHCLTKWKLRIVKWWWWYNDDDENDDGYIMTLKWWWWNSDSEYMTMMLMLVVELYEFMHCRVIWHVHAFKFSPSGGDKWRWDYSVT